MMFSGFRVLRDQHWPTEHVGHQVYSYRGSPAYQWLVRTFLRREPKPTMERGRPIMRDQDPVIYGGHTIICSPRQYLELLKAAQ